MSHRRDDVVADVAWGARGVSIPCQALHVYSGPAWPGMGQISEWGLPWMIGFESSTVRAYGGAPAADQDMPSLINRLRNECPDYITLNCGFWYCAADAPSTPDWALPQITAYGARMHQIAIDNGWNPKCELPYGNRAAAWAGVVGSRSVGGNGQMWGVGTWGFGENGWPYSLPDDSDAWILQSGNTPGPVPGDTDYNGVYFDLSEFGYYGGPQSAPVTKPNKRRSKMYVVAVEGGQGWFVINDDGSLGSKFTGEVDPTYGVPLELGSPVWQQIPAKRMSNADYEIAKALQGKG